MQALLIERHALPTGAVETWTLNEPGSRNALTQSMLDALEAACSRARADAELRGVVLRGAGGHFCAGGSLGGFASTIGRPLGAGEADPLVPMNRAFGSLLQAFCALPQWLVVAVQGAAMGGGLGLVCCADYALAQADAKFAAPEVTLGIVPAQIAPFLVQRLGASAARRWLLMAERHSADSALCDGLVNEVAADAAAFDVALADVVRRFTATAPQAIAATKRLLQDYACSEQSLPPLLDAAALQFAQSLRGSEAPLGLAAFAAHRAPAWSATA